MAAKETTQEAPQLSAEQAADLAALQFAAAVEPVAMPGAPVEPPRPALADELKALALAFVGIAAPMLPSLARIYTEETTTAAAAAVAAVCEKHGWLTDGVMGDYAEEIAAAVVLLPLGFATVQGVRGDLAALRIGNAKAEEAKRIAASAPPPPPTEAQREAAILGGAVSEPVE